MEGGREHMSEQQSAYGWISESIRRLSGAYVVTYIIQVVFRRSGGLR